MNYKERFMERAKYVQSQFVWEQLYRFLVNITVPEHEERKKLFEAAEKGAKEND